MVASGTRIDTRGHISGDGRGFVASLYSKKKKNAQISIEERRGCAVASSSK